MKKRFSRRRNSSSVLVWTFGSAFVVLAVFFIVRTFLPGVFIAAATPFWKEGTALDAGVGNAFVGLTNAKILAQQNAALMAILGFPLVTPLLMILSRLATTALEPVYVPGWWSLALVLAALDVLVIFLGLILFPFLWQE